MGMATGLFKDPTGKIVRLELTEDQLRSAYESGYTPFTHDDLVQEQYGGLRGQLLTGLTGVAKGASLGASDAFLAGQGEGVRQVLTNLRQANPGTALLSEIGGMIGGTLLTKKVPTPAGLASSIGSRAAASAEGTVLRAFTKPGVWGRTAAKIAGEAARGGVEGGIFGAGAGLSEAALGDPERVGELVVAGALEGTAFGGLLGGAVGAIGGLGGAVKGKIADRISKRAAVENEQYAAVLRVLKEMGVSEAKAGKLIARKGDQFMEDIRWLLMEAPAVNVGKDAMQPVLTQGVKNVDEAAERLAKAWQGAGQEIEGLKSYMRRAAREFRRSERELTTPGYTRFQEVYEPGEAAARKAFTEAETGVGRRPVTAQMKYRVEPEFTPTPRISKFKPYFSRGELAAEFETVLRKEAPEAIAGQDVATLWDNLEAMVIRVRKGEGAVGKRAGYYDFTHLQEFKQQLKGKSFVERQLRRFLADKQEQLVRNAGGEKLLQGYRLNKRIYRASRDLADQMGIRKILEGEGVLRKAAKRAGRHAANAAVWRMAYKGGLDPKAMAQMGIFGLPVFLAVEGAQKFAGAWKPPLARAYGKLQKMSTLGAMQTRVDGFHQKFRDAIQEAIKGSRRALTYGYVVSRMTGEKDRQKALNKYRASITRLATDPNALLDAVTASVASFADDAPQIATHSAATIGRAVRFAQSVLPPVDTVSHLHSQFGEDVYSDSVLARMDRILGAIGDPVTAIRRIASGVATPEEIEALRQVHPQLMMIAGQMLSEAVADLGRPLTWQESLRLSPFLGSVGHAMLKPMNMAVNQRIYQTPETQSEPAMSRPSALGKERDTSLSYQTATQRLENPR
jgi:hypothetical protein